MALGKKGVTVFMTVLLAVCLAGLERIKENGEAVRAEAGAAAGRVAITFDDGPYGETTEYLLDQLRERGVKASFFLIGRNIEGNEGLVEQMDLDGHLIGSHTFHHVKLTGLSTEEACREILETGEAISRITGKQVQYIRPPFGAWNRELEQAVDMIEVAWTVDPEDWKLEDPEEIARRVLAEVKDGDIILLHDVYRPSVEAALEIIDTLRAEGYEFVTADQLILD